jgi:ubiquinone/menaquinone biosynthesis C-methylase UbiE
MGLRNKLFAAAYDAILSRCEQNGLSDMRRELLAQATGDVVELGAGTGLNLEHYPAEVSRLVLTEPDPEMAKKLRQRVQRESRSAEVVEAPGEQLPFPDDSFDTAIATLILCTAPEPGRVLGEVNRVLKPGGSFLFLEHVRAPDGSGLSRWQDRLMPVQRFIGCGCHPNRRTAAAIESSPLEVLALRETELPKQAGPLARPAILGAAKASSL